MKELEKLYETPEVKILEINVEKGFACSATGGGEDIGTDDDDSI